MATSSIFKNFVIEGEEQVEKFVAALEASAKEQPYRTTTKVREMTDKNEVLALIERRRKMNTAHELKR